MISSRLNKLITIQKSTSGVSDVISPEPTWEDYMVTYANVYNRAGDTRFSEVEEFVYTTEFEIRYNSLSREINNKYQVIYNEQTYRIIQVIETEYRHAIKIIGVLYYGED